MPVLVGLFCLISRSLLALYRPLLTLTHASGMLVYVGLFCLRIGLFCLICRSLLTLTHSSGMLSVHRSPLPYNRSLLTLTQTSGMPVYLYVSFVRIIGLFCAYNRSLLPYGRPLLTLTHTYLSAGSGTDGGWRFTTSSARCSTPLSLP